MITLSIVSHRQGPLVTALLQDIARIASPRVAAIIVTRNLPEAPFIVPDTLRAITTVVDNAKPVGFGANHNAAFDRCVTPHFIVLNPDIRLLDDPFAAIATSLGTARVGLAAPDIVAPDGRREDAARKLITPWGLLAHRVMPGRRLAAAEFDWLAGMFMAIRSEAFREVGGFDKRFFLYCEDFDLCARLRLAGWQIAVVDQVRVVHAAQRTSHRSMKYLRWHFTSLWKMWTSAAFWRYRAMLASAPR